VEVELVTFAEATRVAGTNQDQLIKHITSGILHLSIVPAALLICLDSLLHISETAKCETLAGN